MLVMGIVNATPDSFADGGAYDPVEHALQLARDGADWIDIGGESTRPGSMPVEEAEEERRVIPVIEHVRARCAVSRVDRHPKARDSSSGARRGRDDVERRQRAEIARCPSHLRRLRLRCRHHAYARPSGDDAGPPDLRRRAGRGHRVSVPTGGRRHGRGRGEGEDLVGSRHRLWQDDRAQPDAISPTSTGSRLWVFRSWSEQAERVSWPRRADTRKRPPTASRVRSRSPWPPLRAGVAMVRVHDVKETVQALDMTAAIERHA